jgi:hypothetical protein
MGLLAKISLRKASVQITNQAIETEIEAIKQGRGRPVSDKDVHNALRSGEEVCLLGSLIAEFLELILSVRLSKQSLTVVRMHCVNYDKAFMKDVEENLVIWKRKGNTKSVA